MSLSWLLETSDE